MERTLSKRTKQVSTKPPALEPHTLRILENIQRRILWLATNMIHHANHVRPNSDGTKVGGHQASSASTVTLMTALYFHFLKRGDRVAVKPHSSPIFHSIQYLLGNLPKRYLTMLREYGGLQSYPSRTKDPEHVDFSTGSVGLGIVAPLFASLTQRYLRDHGVAVPERRFVAVVGDAELDEGNVWEALLDEALDGIGQVVWVVDLNRQSLDRVVPGIRAARLKKLFAQNGWRVLEAKYGRKLQELYALPGGDTLRRRIDEMSNEEYQATIRLSGVELRERLLSANEADRNTLALVLAQVPDEELPSVFANLGGHDLEEMCSIFDEVDRDLSRPTVVFAYTIKGWGLPIAGHPLNHSMLLSSEQMEQLRTNFGISDDDIWPDFDTDTPEGVLCQQVARRLDEDAIPPIPTISIPTRVDLSVPNSVSTQDAFGRLLVRFADIPELAQYMVTTSPDVSVSTNLGGWINRMGVYTPHAHVAEYEGEAQRILRWQRSQQGRHIELGISEMNLFMMAGMAGLSYELTGAPLVPIGTVYDPFVLRGLDSFIYAVYSGAKFIVAGTPSGITLAPEGGAHQSTITASVGIELPKLMMAEPCFAGELEWFLLEGVRNCFDREHGRPLYLRLSTRPMNQTHFETAKQRIGVETLYQQVLNGAYRLASWQDAHPELHDAPKVMLCASGTVIPETLEAAELLWREGVAADVINVVSARALYERFVYARRHGDSDPFSWLFADPQRAVPIITIHDAATHALAWFGSVYGARVTSLGVDDFGQSGARDDLYRHFGVDAMSIADAAFRAIDEA
ncbi:MAG: pyruvate dehydrogenase [Chloroflexi bacterium]|nr:pyruvate dehydrogenase [Chloroflexota bacterium]